MASDFVVVVLDENDRFDDDPDLLGEADTIPGIPIAVIIDHPLEDELDR